MATFGGHAMQPRLAVLIDADNIAATLAPQILSRAVTLGMPVIRRIYGRPGVVPAWMEATKEELFEYHTQPTVASAKNGADIALAIDAMDILYAGAVTAFCIVSNDRDFVPLALRLRAAGKATYAVCKRGGDRYTKAFDLVFELDQPDDAIVEAFRKITNANKQELKLAEVGKLLRAVAPAGLIPPAGKGRLRKTLEATQQFEFLGNGADTRVRLTA